MSKMRKRKNVTVTKRNVNKTTLFSQLVANVNLLTNFVFM